MAQTETICTLAQAAEEAAHKLHPLIAATSPDHSMSISQVISDLYTIGGILRNINTLAQNPTLRPCYNLIRADLTLVVFSSLKHTIRDMRDALSWLDNPKNNRKVNSVSPQDQMWYRLWTIMYNQDHHTMTSRIRSYVQMLEGMRLVLKNKPADENEMVILRERFIYLNSKQTDDYANRMAHRNQRNDEPPVPPQHPQPQSPPPPPPPMEQKKSKKGFPWDFTQSTERRRARSPSRVRTGKAAGQQQQQQTKTSGKQGRTRPRSPPPTAPWPPMGSPHSSNASPFWEASDESGSESDGLSFIKGPKKRVNDFPDHWSLFIFSQEMMSETPLSSENDTSSKCYGPRTDDVMAKIFAKFTPLLRIEFAPNSSSDPKIAIEFYIHGDDHEVWVVCEIDSKRHGLYHSAYPITKLRIERRDQSRVVLFRTPNHAEGTTAWVNLDFDIVEKLELFYLTFLALRAQDSSNPVTYATDHAILGEECIYEGVIKDDGFLHALRIFRDTDFNTLRLEAAIMEGDMIRTPVWTAFIHAHIRERKWCRKVAEDQIRLSQLQRFVFIHKNAYKPHVSRKGEHVLDFPDPSHLEGFKANINDLIRTSPIPRGNVRLF